MLWQNIPQSGRPGRYGLTLLEIKSVLPVVGGHGHPDLVPVLALPCEGVLQPTAVQVGGITMEHGFADIFKDTL